MTGSSHEKDTKVKTDKLILEIHEFSQMDPGKTYSGIPYVSLSEGNLNFGIGIASSSKQLKLVLKILGKNGKPDDTLPETTLSSVKLIMNPTSGEGKTVAFQSVQLSKTNKMTEILTLLSENELRPFIQGNFMQLVINVVHDKAEEKPKEKGNENENGKTPAWKIVVPILVVLLTAGIAVGFLVRRKRIYGKYFW